MSARVVEENSAHKANAVGRRCGPWLGPPCVIVLVAVAAVVPMFVIGIPSGHDLEFHITSWMEVVEQWKQGIVYPRWASGAHFGFGEARFLLYPPASWLLGALLGLALPWPFAPAAYVLIALLLAGCSSFYLARQFLAPRDATFAAAFYAVNPYHLIIIYWRSAFAELLASCLLPLLLLLVLHLEKSGKKMVVPLALLVAAGWLANAPSAVMINYSLALLVVLLTVLRRSPRLLAYGGSAVLLGAALAAFYVLPAAYEEKWVNIAQVLSPGVRPQDNFLFTTVADEDHNRFNLLVSLVALAEIALMLVLGFLVWHRRRETPQIWWPVFVWAAACVLLMLSPTLLLWQHLPELRFVQLPWRWLLCLNVVLALFMAVGARRWMWRAGVYVAAIAMLLFVGFKVQPPWWDSSEDIIELHDNIVEGRGYEGTDEYVPAGADASETVRDAPKVAVEDGGRARVNLEQWGPESKLFTVAVSQPTRLVVHLFNYPAWRVEVNGQRVPAGSEEKTGQMIIPIPAGVDRVQVRFVRTWDRKLAAAVSLSTLLLMVGLAIYFDG
ncbi:MAG: hypothetical protein JO249_11865 [Acidobacteria bacterium]|nr:hypothetical protein [Acidobacteriota bacterium]